MSAAALKIMTYTILGHGSLEEGTLHKTFQVPASVAVYIWTPPGAAIAGGLADGIHQALCKERNCREKVKQYGASLKLEVRFRETKGASSALHDSYSEKVTMPLEYLPGTNAPNLTVTGASSIATSGIYAISPTNVVTKITLGHGVTQNLADVAEMASRLRTAGEVCYVHWLACASDHTTAKAQSTSLFEDQKLDFVKKS